MIVAIGQQAVKADDLEMREAAAASSAPAATISTRKFGRSPETSAIATKCAGEDTRVSHDVRLIILTSVGPQEARLIDTSTRSIFFSA